MSILLMIVIGAAAGLVATKLMGVDLGLLPTISVGVIGALLGGVVLRFLLTMMGPVAALVGGVLGAMALLWLYQRYGNGDR